MKKYIDVDLQIVHLNNSDIIVTSEVAIGGDYVGGSVETAGRRMDDWDGGY